MNVLLLETGSVHAGATEVTRLLLALGVLLLAARALGELARYFGYPSVLGELSAGILLGPGICGRGFPEAMQWLFPTQGASAVVLDGLRTLSVTLFLLVAGLEVDLSRIARRSKAAFYVSMFGIGVPFAVGWATGWLAPGWLGFEGRSSHAVFALFVATALSISALPVIARTLMDLSLYKSDFGMIVIASAILNDLAGWIVFAIILGLIQSADSAPDVGLIALLAVGFALGMLTVGRWIVHRLLPWVQAHTAWPGGVIVFSISFALASAAFTEWVGIHAIFGAFLAGVALGDSAHLRERTRATVAEFVSSFFAPLFFALVGLRVDFVSNFDWAVVLVVLAIACAGKLIGCSLGARASGISWRESLAIGFAMNARGSMEIILGMTAFQNGLIGERLLVALVFMALATSVMSGPAIQRALGRSKPARFARALNGRAFIRSLDASTEADAVRTLATAAARATGMDAARIEAALPASSRALGEGARAHCVRLEGLDWPVVALGLSRRGVPVAGAERGSLMFLVLTPPRLEASEAEILDDLVNTLAIPGLREKILAARDYTELLALLRADGAAR